MTRKQRKYGLDIVVRAGANGSPVFQVTLRKWEHLGWVKRHGIARNAAQCWVLTPAGRRERQRLEAYRK